MNSKFVAVFAIVSGNVLEGGKSGQSQTLLQKFSNDSEQFFILSQNVNSIHVMNLWTNQILYKEGFQNM